MTHPLGVHLSGTNSLQVRTSTVLCRTFKTLVSVSLHDAPNVGRRHQATLPRKRFTKENSPRKDDRGPETGRYFEPLLFILLRVPPARELTLGCSTKSGLTLPRKALVTISC